MKLMTNDTAAPESPTAPDSAPGREPLTLGIVGNQGSVHIQRWSSALAARGHTIVPIDLVGRGRNPLQRVAAFLELRRAMARVARAERGVVVVHNIPGGLLALGMRGIHPIVVHAWGADVTTELPGPSARFRGRQLRGLIRAADARTATSRFLAETVRRRFDVDPKVVPFGIDTDRFRPRAGERRPGPPRIGFVKMRLDATYGPDVLVEALGRLPEDQPFEMLIAGDGGMRPVLEARIADLGLADRVRFLGVLAHAEIEPLLADLDIFAMPSRREAWGVAAAEASAVGLPVVASRVGGVPEIVVDGETGLLVPAEDPAALAAALGKLLADPEFGARMGRAGRARIEADYRWDGCADAMEAVYRGVLPG
jgi:glycosyltransferase involved in cell wall biosynthesis